MMLKKKGMPEENEVVLCTVTKVQFHSVFVTIDEYENKSGMIHISEISPGRIRNIRDFVKEDKVIVCKVLRINMERGHIDLSLRRVTESQRREKVNNLKKEQVVDKILESAGKEQGKKSHELYDAALKVLKEEYGNVYDFFEAIVMEEDNISKLGFDEKLSKDIEVLVKQRIKPREVHIRGAFNIVSYEPDGVEHIKEALMEAEKVDENVDVRYNGAGKYSMDVKAENYKDAEKIVAETTKIVVEIMKKHKGEAAFVREEKKN